MSSRYVVLLRGVNVGGNHRLPKAEFRSVLENLGCEDVEVYINSGNAVLTHDHMPPVETVQAALERHFGFTIPTLVLPGQQIKAIADAIPHAWTNDSPKPDKSGNKSDVLYLFDDVDTADTITQLGHKPEVEEMIYVEGAILTSVSRANQAKGSLQKLVGTKLYSRVTIRNITTAKKLAELVG